MKLVKVPGVNGLGKTRGTRDAADLVLEGLDFERVELDGSLDKQMDVVFDKAEEFLHEPDGVIFVGGDHSISYPIVKSFFGKDPSGRLVVFDAHPDLMPPMKEPTHEEWLSALVEGGVRGEDILLIGARKIEPEEGEFLAMSGIKTISVEEVRFDLARALRKLRNFVSHGDVYVSFDVDVFDSRVVKATGYAEPDGFSEEEVERLIGVTKEGNVIAGDLVEVNLDFDDADVKETVRIARSVLDRLKE